MTRSRRSELFLLALAPGLIALALSVLIASPFAAAALSGLIVAGRAAWLWSAGFIAGALVRKPLHAVGIGLLVAGASVLLSPAFDAEGFTGAELLDGARFDIAVIAALIGQSLRAVWASSGGSAQRAKHDRV